MLAKQLHRPNQTVSSGSAGCRACKSALYFNYIPSGPSLKISFDSKGTMPSIYNTSLVSISISADIYCAVECKVLCAVGN